MNERQDFTRTGKTEDVVRMRDAIAIVAGDVTLTQETRDLARAELTFLDETLAFRELSFYARRNLLKRGRAPFQKALKRDRKAWGKLRRERILAMRPK